MSVYKYEYLSVIESEDKMLSNLAHVLTKEGVENPERYGFMLAISEAFTNALLHGNRLDPTKKIWINLEIKSNSLKADIIDEGKGGIDQINKRKPSKLLDTNGRGVDLIEYYAAEYDISEYKNGGVKVSVTFDRDKETISK
ncbi:MAG: ATP-binding protein [Calditrichaeota bacterium]|nr:MAG: ATP-binding protein [Calditrichota bacterium]